MSSKKLFLAVFTLVIISWPSYSFAGQGCCSYHGGQSYCDSSSGRWVCQDGTYSPSCTCAVSVPTRSYPSTLEQAAKEWTPEKHIADLQQEFDSCMAIAKQKRSEADSCAASLAVQQKNTETYYADLQDQKSTTFYIFLFAVASAILNIWFYKRTSR